MAALDTLALVLTPATSTLPYGTNVQNNCGWISFWSVETLTISVGAANYSSFGGLPLALTPL